jgi:flagellar FliL protein
MAVAAAEEVVDTVPEPKKGKSRKMLIAGIIVSLLAAGGGAGYYFLGHKSSADHGKAAEKATPRTMVYVPLETFTVNLHNAEADRYLQLTINLEVADSSTADAIKVQMPSIRNRILLLLSSQDAESLMRREGKEKLAAEIVAELRKTLEGDGPSKGLAQVLFSQFVIQ